MKRQVLLLLGIAVASGYAQSAAVPPTKVGVIHIQNALMGTKEGQAAAQDLDTRYIQPKKKEMQQKQDEIAALQSQFQKGVNTMSEDNKRRLASDIDTKTKQLNRAQQDAEEELQGEQNKLLQGLGGKMMAIIDKYAKDNAYTIIFDVSNPQTPVLYIHNGIDITAEIVALYDKANASAGATAAPKPTTTPKPMSTPAPKPTATPQQKKQ